MSAAPRKPLTPEEYLKAERLAEFKSEYIGGDAFAMAGGKFNHSCISSNIIRSTGNLLAAQSCKVLGSDMRVSPYADSYFYPDVSIACGQTKFLDDKKDTLLNPIVIVEVLSPSTATFDRGSKFFAYRQMPSLQDYILVSQDRVLVEHHARQADGSWLLREYRQLSDLLKLDSLGISVPLTAIYERVEFEA